MKKVIISLYILLIVFNVLYAQEIKPEIIHAEDKAPEFSLKTLDGANFNLTDYRGKVVFLNFFATWCGSCMKEIPYVESEIWHKIKHPDFVMLAIAREQKTDEIKKFKAEREFTMPMAVDEDRSVYSLYAPQYIPRNIVINRKGEVIYIEKGYDAEEFNQLLALIKKELENK